MAKWAFPELIDEGKLAFRWRMSLPLPPAELIQPDGRAKAGNATYPRTLRSSAQHLDGLGSVVRYPLWFPFSTFVATITASQISGFSTIALGMCRCVKYLDHSKQALSLDVLRTCPGLTVALRNLSRRLRIVRLP